MPSDSTELLQVLAEAQDIAQSVGHRLTTAHLLLAVFTAPNRAQLLLKDRGIDENRLLETMTQAPSEPEQVSFDLLDRTREIAQNCNWEEADAGHMLIALTRMRSCAGLDLLLKCGVDVTALRTKALSYYLAGSMPRRFRESAPLSAASPAPQIPARPSTVELPSPSLAPRAPPTPPKPLAPPSSPASRGGSAFELDDTLFPWLTSIGRNLTLLAEHGQLDPVIGRAHEIDEIVDILGKRRTNNPCLVGEPGVGKTAVVEGVAQAFLKAQSPRILIELDLASIVAGTQLRGSFSEKLNGLKDEMKRAGGRVIAFIDELHTLVGAGATGEGSQDAANELKAALARGEFPCIGATTYDEYRKFIATDPALERRFTAITIREPTVEETRALLGAVSTRYAEHHRVVYSPEALDAAASLSARYITERHLPDKAISLIDLAGSRAHRERRDRVEASDIAAQVSRVARIPLERLTLQDSTRLLHLEADLSRRVIGHEAAIARIAQVIRRNYAGFASRRPMGSFLFLGPSGVGKTELARALAETLFGDANSLVALDMSEYSESHATARLVGAPPGYVGYGDAGQLTEPVRQRPASVILFDEIEKAHRDVLMLLLQVLDEGRLTDAKGRQIDFSNAVVVMTSNLGSESFGKSSGPLGFGAPSSTTSAPDPGERALEAARGRLPIEFWNRLDERLVFEPLTHEQRLRIAALLVEGSAARLQQEKGIQFRADATLIAHLVETAGADAALGARPMRQTIQRELEAPLADAILRGEVSPGAQLEIGYADGLVFQSL